MSTIEPRARRIVPPEQRIRPARENVRAAIRAAATEHFLAVGYRAAKLEDIARAAGFTKGAIYSNFTSKQGLFLDLLSTRIEAFSEEVEGRFGAATNAKEVIDIFCASLAREVTRETAWHALVVEFAAAAATDEAISAQYIALRKQRREDVAARLQAAGIDVSPAMARTIAVALLAAVHGLSLELASDRAAISEQDVAAVLGGILGVFIPRHA